jgi:hypothetical protein
VRSRADRSSEIARHRTHVVPLPQTIRRRTSAESTRHLESVDLHLAGRKLDCFHVARARIRGERPRPSPRRTQAGPVV